MHRRILILIATLSCIDGSLGSLAHAQQVEGSVSDEEGRGLFVAGRAAYEEGRYADALAYFQRSYEVSQRAALLYNIGQAQDRLRYDAEALESFRKYVALMPDAPNVKEANNRIRALEAIVERATKEREAAAAVATANESAPAASAPSAASEPAEPAPTQPAPAAATAATSDKAEGGGLLSQWWFWTAAGVVVSGVVVGAFVLGASEETEKARAGNTGISIPSLRFR